MLHLMLLAVLHLLVVAYTPTYAQEDGQAIPDAEISGIYRVGDRSLALDCSGSGSPTVVLDHGQNGSGVDLVGLQVELARDFLVCRYDRAGMGQSDLVPFPRTAADAVADLHGLLAAAAVPGPYVLVGQSAGGAFVQLYARTYPEEVASVVAMNPVPPAGPWLKQALPLMTDPERAEEDAFYQGEGDGEQFDWYASFAELDAAPAPPNVPFLVVISTIAQCESPDDICGRTYGVYETTMQELAAMWPQGQFLQLETGHEIYQHSDAVTAIRRAIEAARDPETWATPLAGMGAT